LNKKYEFTTGKETFCIMRLPNLDFNNAELWEICKAEVLWDRGHGIGRSTMSSSLAKSLVE
jgi:hypothetical protein